MKKFLFLCSAASILFATSLASRLSADDAATIDDTQAAKIRQALESAKDKLTNQPVTLVYQFKAGETVRSKVTHLVSVETKIQGVVQVAKTRSVATKSWQIKSVDGQGNMTLVHSVSHVDMWQKVSGRDEVRYDSDSKDEPPADYTHVAASVGVPLATITISPAGRIIKREDVRDQFNPGIGGLTVPLPETAIRVGQQWSTPDEVRVRLTDGRTKRVRTRQLYTLQKVAAGVATIGMKTEVLTPVNDAKVESQLVQRLKVGTIKFDMKAGRVISQQMDMDKSVVGFNGNDSLMKYLARFTEESIPERSARRGAASKK